MLIEQQFDTGEVVLNYVESAHSRPPIVMLHGMTMRWQYYLPALPALSARWHTFALDQRGHGKSGRVVGGYGWEAFTRDCVAFLRAQATEPAVLMGHSLGGNVAVAVAAQAPELVRALVLEDPGLLGHRGADRWIPFRNMAASGLSLNGIADRLAALNPGRDIVWCRRRASYLRMLDPDVVTAHIDGQLFEGFDAEKLLPAVTCPVLLLRADPAHGGAIPDTDQAKVLALLKDAALVDFQGVGHPILGTDPGAVVQKVSDFLESLD